MNRWLYGTRVLASSRAPFTDRMLVCRSLAVCRLCLQSWASLSSAFGGGVGAAFRLGSGGMTWLRSGSGGGVDSTEVVVFLAPPQARAPVRTRTRVVRIEEVFTPSSGGMPALDLVQEEERDEQRVDDQRLDEGEAEDHRREHLVGGARVAGDAVQRGRRGTALAERPTERGEGDAQAGGDGDPLRRIGLRDRRRR